MHLHEFLAHLHDVLKPRVYLEVGVQYGTSLALAERSAIAYGVDPNPLIWGSTHHRDNQEIYAVPSDEFFAQMSAHLPHVDLGFIDGLHLFEQALKDFINLEQVMEENGIIVMDDVLPYNQAIAAREQPPGDWTGDVWKVIPILRRWRPELKLSLINTAPTGTLVVTGAYDRIPKWDYYEKAITPWFQSDEVPMAILGRWEAHEPTEFLEGLRHARDLD